MTKTPAEGIRAASPQGKSLQGLPVRTEYLGHQRLPDAIIADQASPGIRVKWQVKRGARISIVQRYLVAEDRAYLHRAHAPSRDGDGDGDEHGSRLEACLGSFRLIEPTAADEAAMTTPATERPMTRPRAPRALEGAPTDHGRTAVAVR